MSSSAEQYNITIIKAVNGWVCINRPPGNPFSAMEYVDDVIVVKEGENLSEAIASMITSQRLQGKPAQKSNPSISQTAAAALGAIQGQKMGQQIPSFFTKE